MARGKAKESAALQPRRRLATTEARTELPKLVQEATSITRPAPSLAQAIEAHGTEVGAYRQGGLWFLPAADVRAALRRDEAQQARIDELEDELEVVGIALLAQERLANPTAVEELIPVEELAKKYGLEDLI